MVRLSAILCVCMAFSSALVAFGQEKKAEPTKGEQKAAEAPEGKPGAAGAPSGAKGDAHQAMKQLEDVMKTLSAPEQAAIEADPALQAERQAILDQIEQTIDKIRAFDEKVDEKVLATSPESKQLVQEKRDLMAQLEAQAHGKKGDFAMKRLLRFVAGGTIAGREKEGKRPKGKGAKAGAAQ